MPRLGKFSVKKFEILKLYVCWIKNVLFSVKRSCSTHHAQGGVHILVVIQRSSNSPLASSNDMCD